MLDILDIMNGRLTQTSPALYFEEKPERIAYITCEDDLYKIHEGEPFDYEFVSPNEYRYKSLISNLMTDGSSPVILTKDRLNWKTTGYVILADGKSYLINAWTEDTSEVNKEAFRMLPIPLGTKYILSLTQYDDGGIYEPGL